MIEKCDIVFSLTRNDLVQILNDITMLSCDICECGFCKLYHQYDFIENHIKKLLKQIQTSDKEIFKGNSGFAMQFKFSASEVYLIYTILKTEEIFGSKLLDIFEYMVTTRELQIHDILVKRCLL